ncbi:MAG: helix-turn-helix transcriptional regulator [Sphingomonadales bacterium]|nr:helix-turn-helix transcriptional regulator [Sphingomonadales bacterium]
MDPQHAGGCPAEVTLTFLAGKWRPMTIWWLMQGPMRFNELQRRLGQVTHRTLTRTLREMEADGLVQRTDHGENPPRVDYALTALGRSLEEVLQAMARWESDHRATDHRDLPKNPVSSGTGLAPAS